MATRTWTRIFMEQTYLTGSEALAQNPQIAGLLYSENLGDTLVRSIVDAQCSVTINSTAGGGPAYNWPAQIHPMICVGRDETPGERVMDLSTFVDHRVVGTELLVPGQPFPSIPTGSDDTVTFHLTRPLDSKGMRKALHPDVQPALNVTIQAYPTATVLTDAFTWEVNWWIWARALWETP